MAQQFHLSKNPENRKQTDSIRLALLTASCHTNALKLKPKNVIPSPRQTSPAYMIKTTCKKESNKKLNLTLENMLHSSNNIGCTPMQYRFKTLENDMGESVLRSK